jgi:hypothetical protein
MSKTEFDYYLIDLDFRVAKRPQVNIVDKEGDNQDPSLYKLEFENQFKDPFMADYFFEELFSEKIAEVLKNLNIEGIRLIPTKWVKKQKDRTEKYFYLQVDNEFEVMDKDKSEYEYEHRMYSIEELVVAEEFLKIPLEKRLVFEMSEEVETLFHKSVVDAIMATKPTGLKFKPFGEDYEVVVPKLNA